MDIALTFTFEVEVGMIGEIDDGRLVGVGIVIDVEVIALHDVTHYHMHIARETFLTIWREVVQRDGISSNFLHIPHLIVETMRTTMQGMLATILRKMIKLTIYLGLCITDTTSYSTIDAIEIDLLSKTLIQGRKS